MEISRTSSLMCNKIIIAKQNQRRMIYHSIYQIKSTSNLNANTIISYIISNMINLSTFFIIIDENLDPFCDPTGNLICPYPQRHDTKHSSRGCWVLALGWCPETILVQPNTRSLRLQDHYSMAAEVLRYRQLLQS